MPLGLMWNDGFTVPILKQLWLGRLPRSVTENSVAGAEWEKVAYDLLLKPPPMLVGASLSPSQAATHLKVGFILEKKSLVIKLL